MQNLLDNMNKCQNQDEIKDSCKEFWLIFSDMRGKVQEHLSEVKK